MTGIGKYNLQPYTNYPLGPPRLSCCLALHRRTFFEDEQVPVHLFIQNNSPYPVTFYSATTIFYIQSAIEHYMIEVIDLLIWKPISQSPIYYYIGESYATDDDEIFHTIDPHNIWTNVASARGKFIAGHSYSIKIQSLF
jgi:hypothetical protein